MAARQQSRLLGCGHYGRLSAVCQYREGPDSPPHALELCQECHVACDTGGRVLCREHQHWTSDRRHVFCQEHYRDYWIRDKLGKLLFGGEENGF